MMKRRKEKQRAGRDDVVFSGFPIGSHSGLLLAGVVPLSDPK